MTTTPLTTDDESRALSDALGRLATTPRLLVALDFDGTLAPEVDQPMAARPLPESKEAIRRLLELEGTSVALVSGRDLASLDRISEMPEQVLLVGSHGIEVRIGGEVTSLTDDELARRAVISEALHTAADGREGVFVEEKPAGLALHTRLADEATTTEVREAVRQRAHRHDLRRHRHFVEGPGASDRGRYADETVRRGAAIVDGEIAAADRLVRQHGAGEAAGNGDVALHGLAGDRLGEGRDRQQHGEGCKDKAFHKISFVRPVAWPAWMLVRVPHPPISAGLSRCFLKLSRTTAAPAAIIRRPA